MPVTTYPIIKRSSKFSIGDLIIKDKVYYRVMEEPKDGKLICLPHDPNVLYAYVIFNEEDVDEERYYITYVEPSVKGNEINVGIYHIK
jgi:hypothetical protein